MAKSPQLSKALVELIQKTKTTQLLYIILLMAVFIIGYLFAKVRMLEGGSTTNTQTAAQTAGTQGQTPIQTPTPATVQNVGLGHFPIKGDNNAKVTVVEFADFRCPFCEQFFTNTESQLFKDYVDTGKVKFAFRQFPFLGPASVVAADAAECANDQGKFWEFHDYLYKNQPPENDTSMYTTDTLTQDAVSLGMDGTKFRSCLDGKTDDSKAQGDMADGQKIGVNGTPTFFINGVELVGAQPYSAFQAQINKALGQ